MSEITKTIILGAEYDESLRNALRVVLVGHGGACVESLFGVGGSQEIETFSVRLGDDLVVVEAETYVGISISGPQNLVSEIALEVKRRLEC